MSYLDRLRLKISAKVPDVGATKVSKGAFVPFVAGLSAPFDQISAVNDLLINKKKEARLQRVLTTLDDNPALRLAVVCDGEGDPVPVAIAIRDKGSVEVLIPAARFDPFALLELVERHTGH